MGEQIDFIGGGAPTRARPELRNQRATISEQKAQLVLLLGRLCLSCPPSVRNGSVNLTRRWLEAQKRCKAVAGSTRASVTDLSLAIKEMSQYTGDVS